MAVLAINKRANLDFEILETFEAGLLLTGGEVKSIKAGRMGLKGAYVVMRNNEAYLTNASIPPYQMKNTQPDYDSLRSRKLLLRKKELISFIGKTKMKGLTLIPLRVYNTKSGFLKLEFGVGKGRKKRDKRETIKRKEVARTIERAVKELPGA